MLKKPSPKKVAKTGKAAAKSSKKAVVAKKAASGAHRAVSAQQGGATLSMESSTLSPERTTPRTGLGRLAPRLKAVPVKGSKSPSHHAVILHQKEEAEVHQVAAALDAFSKAANELGLASQAQAKLLNLSRSKLFTELKAPKPNLDVDQKDRLGYFLVIYELSERLVGSAKRWLEAPNTAPQFGGKPPLERMLEGRMENLLTTLNYLKAAYGGWA